MSASKILCLFIFIFLSSNILIGQNLSAKQLLAKSIDYHDPDNALLNKRLVFELRETRPGVTDRESIIGVNIKAEIFQLLQKKDNTIVESLYKKGVPSFKVNGSEDFSEEVKKKYQINDQRLIMLRDYYQYLWLLPVKLLDEGTILSDDVKEKDFFGKDALEIKVTYEPTVGNDIWYFYFHPKTYALIGYRFYHDESANDGEYIILEGEVQEGNLRLPKERKWYMHKDDKYLGADICEKLTVR